MSNFMRRPGAVGSNVSVTNYGSYDGLGRVLTGSQQTEGQTYPFAYGYNRDGTLASITYPSGLEVTYTYDDAGRPSSLAGQPVGGSATNYASSMTYHPHGAVEQMLLGNNVWETSAYNSRLQPSSMVTGTTQGGSNPTKLQTRSAMQGHRTPSLPIWKADSALLFWAQHAAPLRGRQPLLAQAVVNLDSPVACRAPRIVA